MPKPRKKEQKKQSPKAGGGDQYHHGDLRAALISTAVKILEKIPPSDLSLRELARQAGVSVAAPYRHFKDKRELLAAIIEEGFEIKSQYMADAIRAAKRRPLDMYYGCGLAYFKMGRLHPQHFKLMVTSEIIPSPEFPGLLKAAAKSFMLLKEMLRFCQSKGLVGAGDPYHKAMHCWCMVNGFTSLYAEGRLMWIGVNPKNAEAALKTLMSQHLIGNKEPMSKSAFGFQPFTTPESDLQKKQILDQPYPEVVKLFEELDG